MGVSVAAAARLLSIPRSTLRYHIERGHAVRTADGGLDVDATRQRIDALIDAEQSRKGRETPSSADDAKQPPLWRAKEETERVRAERMRFDLAVLRGEYVRAQELYDLLSPFWTQAAAHGKSMSARISAQWCAAKTVAEAKALIDAEIRIFLRLLAGGEQA